ncbi:hypothetical protein AGOR_G00131480, partial [Albula goreensis]
MTLNGTQHFKGAYTSHRPPVQALYSDVKLGINTNHLLRHILFDLVPSCEDTAPRHEGEVEKEAYAQAEAQKTKDEAEVKVDWRLFCCSCDSLPPSFAPALERSLSPRRARKTDLKRPFHNTLCQGRRGLCAPCLSQLFPDCPKSCEAFPLGFLGLLLLT